MNKSEFYKHPQMSRISSGLRCCGFSLYIFGGLNVLSMFNFEYGIVVSMIASFIGVLICILGFLIHMCQSRAAAIALTVLGALYMIWTVLRTGYFTGWFYGLIGLASIMFTFEFQKAWKQYQETGIVPLDPQKMF